MRAGLNTALVLLLAALAACGPGEAPVGRWQGAAFDGEWLIAVRLEIAPGNVVRVSAPNLHSDFARMGPAERERAWAAIVKTLDRQFAEAQPGAVEMSGDRITRAGGYAPLFERDGATGALVFCFYGNGALTHRIPLEPVTEFGPPPRPPRL